MNRASHAVSPISKLRTPHHILHITHPLYYTGLPTVYTYIAVQCCAVQCSGLQTRWTRPNEKRNVLLRPTAGERNPHDLIFLRAARKVLRLWSNKRRHQTRWTRPNKKRKVLICQMAKERNQHDLIFFQSS